MHQLILQNRHVIYREIETILGISGTSIHSILYEDLTIEKNLFALDPTQFVNRSHTSAQTTAFLSTQNLDLMSHPPYSPDLIPNDFFLFPYVKKISMFFDT